MTTIVSSAPGERHRVALPGALREDRGDGGGEHARAGQDHEVRAQPVIGLLQQPLERARPAVAGLRAVADAVAIDREHRHLGARGERDDHQEHQEGQEQQSGVDAKFKADPFSRTSAPALGLPRGLRRKRPSIRASEPKREKAPCAPIIALPVRQLPEDRRHHVRHPDRSASPAPSRTCAAAGASPRTTSPRRCAKCASRCSRPTWRCRWSRASSRR